MSLMTMRHKPVRALIWFTCILTFYLGFNQQVMCFELDQNGKVWKIHLQLIECKPLSPFVANADYYTGKPIPVTLTASLGDKRCPHCRDFHLSFKKTPKIDLSHLGALASFSQFNYPPPINTFASDIVSQQKQTFLTAQTIFTACNASLHALRTTILLI